MDEMTMLRQARPVAAPPTAEALQTGRTKLIEASRQPVRRRHRRQLGHARQRAQLAGAHGTPRRRLRPATIAAGAAALAGAAVAAAVVTGRASAPAPHRAERIVTAAWTVQVNHDRTVTVTVRQLRDPAGLQRALRREGIPAIVRYVPIATEKVDGQEVSGPACDYLLPTFPPAASREVIVSGAGGPATASPAQPTPSPSPIPRPAPSSMPRPTPSVSPGVPAGSTAEFTIRPQAIPKGATIFISSSFTKSGESGDKFGGFGVSLVASDHLPRCVPLSEWLRGHK